MTESVYVPSTLKEGYFADLPAPVAGDDARPITYNHATLSYVYSDTFATAAQAATVASNLNTHANLTNGAHGISAFAATFLDDTTQGAVQSTLGLVIGTNVQAYNANLAALAGLTGAADKLGYFTGVGALALADFTAVGRSLVGAADAAAGRTALSLGTMATQASNGYLDTGGNNTGATSAIQPFTLGIQTAKVSVLSNGTNAFGLYRADGTTQDGRYDSTNGRWGWGGAPDSALHVYEGSAGSVTALTGTRLAVESSGNTYLSLLAASGSAAGIIIGLGTTNQFSTLTYNRAVANSWDVTENRAGATTAFLFRNQDNTNAASSVRFEANVGGASAGDPYALFTVNGVINWSLGIDNSDSDKFKIGPVASPSVAGQSIIITSAGDVGIGQVTPNSKLDVTGTVQADGLRLDVTPTAETPSTTHTITISVNGTNYKLPCVAA